MTESDVPVERIVQATTTLHQLQVEWSLPSRIKAGQNLLSFSSLPSENRHAWLSIGLPSQPFSSKSPLNLFWFPFGFPQGKSLFIASSRLGRNLHQHQHWFNAFRTLTCRIDPQKTFFISAAKVTSHRFVQRASELFNIPMVQFKSPPQSSKRSWFEKTCRDEFKNSLQWTGFDLSNCFTVQSKSWDHLLCETASEIRVLSIRAGGNVNSAVLKRCKQLEHPNVFVLKSPKNTTAQNQLIQSGCHAWHLLDSEIDQTQNPRLNIRPGRELKSKGWKVSVVAQMPPDHFLIHCTRAKIGHWPDQTENDYLDDLIFQNLPAIQTAKTTLDRILTQGKIIATNRLTRSAKKVVCFTAASTEQLKQLRRFRPHMGRWDFVPTGIAIRKSALEQIGARPVIYGDESRWKELTETDQPFFQIAQSITRRGNLIDWTQEAEWRILGDLDLKQFLPDQIHAFHIPDDPHPKSGKSP